MEQRGQMISGDSVEYSLLAKWTDQLNVMSTDFITTLEIDRDWETHDQ